MKTLTLTPKQCANHPCATLRCAGEHAASNLIVGCSREVD
jgi:hypothetical protein